MKKALSLILVLVVLACTTVTAFAASPRAADTSSKSLSLNIVGNYAVSTVKITAFKSTTPINGTLTVRRGSTVVQSWGINASGSVNTEYRASASVNGNYTATFDGYCGSDHIILSGNATK